MIPAALSYSIFRRYQGTSLTLLPSNLHLSLSSPNGLSPFFLSFLLLPIHLPINSLAHAFYPSISYPSPPIEEEAFIVLIL
jgi:hypothetical protein